MDITPIFRASVMAVKLRNKQVTAMGGVSSSNGKPNEKRLLSPRHKDNEAVQAKDICNKITELKNFLLENRAAYMKFAAHLKSSAQMTDDQRNIIDRESEKLFTFYSQQLVKLKSSWKKQNTSNNSKQRENHIDLVLDLLTNYLRTVNNLHLEQKKYRMHHELETYRLLKLASDKKKIPVKPGGDNLKKLEKIYENSNYNDDDSVHEEEDVDAEGEGSNDLTMNTNKIHSPKKIALDEDLQKSQAQNKAEEESSGLSPEDIQMFESENVQLLQELQGLSQEVEAIEKNVVDIARLQEIFTEKVRLIRFLEQLSLIKWYFRFHCRGMTLKG